MRYSNDNSIFPLRRKIVTIFLIFSTIFNISLAGTYIPEGGAVARFYEYPLGDKTSFNTTEFRLRDYRKNKYLGEITGIRNVSWDSGWPAVVPPYGFDGAPITNFVVSITAYYLAPQTGYYNISLKADDFAGVFVGWVEAFDYSWMHFYDFTENEFRVSNSGSAARGLTPTFGKPWMFEGSYYPIEIIYVNYMERGVLDFELILPDGTVDTEFGERLYAIPDREVPTSAYGQLALSTIYETFTRSVVPGLSTPTTVSTSVYTDWIEGWSADVYVFNYVDEPMSTTASTTTTIGPSVPTTSSFTTLVTSGIDSSTSADISVPTLSSYTTPVTSGIGSSSTGDISVPTTSSYTTHVTSGIGSSTTTDVSVPTTSSYNTQVTGIIGSSTTAGTSVPVTSTYTTVVTGSFGSSSPEVFFNFDLEVEVKY